MDDRILVTFWGTRGSISAPGRSTEKYGGNTSCVSLEFPNGSLFIFDAGTGIKALDLLRHEGPGLHSRKLRSFDEPPLR